MRRPTRGAGTTSRISASQSGRRGSGRSSRQIVASIHHSPLAKRTMDQLVMVSSLEW
jgi:hypothetical protein